MFAVVVVVIGLSISLLVLLAVFAFAFLDVAFAGPERTSASGSWRWQPPLVRGDQLLAWATGVARTTTLRRLQTPHCAKTAKQLAAEIYEGAARAIEESPHAVKQAKPNCPSCRHQMIGVTAPEVLAIADEVRRTKSKRETQRIRNRAAKTTKAATGLNHEQYEQAQIVCPLLDNDNSCAAFDSRPLHCRGWCLFSGEDGDRCLLGSGDAGSLDSHAYTVGRGMEKGLSQGLESAGLDGNVYELNSALNTALDTPDAAVRWAEGKPVFSGCRSYEAATHVPA